MSLQDFQAMNATATAKSLDQISSTGQPSHQPFRLLDLPVEIWSSIVTSVCNRDPSSLTAHRCDLYFQRRLEQAPITRVCKIIRNETLPYFYSQNEFLFDDLGHDLLKGLRTWIKAIGETSYSRIRKLYISSHYEGEDLEYDDLLDHIADTQHKKKNFPFVVVGFEDVYTDDPTDPERRYLLGIPQAAQESSESELRDGGSAHEWQMPK